MSVVRMSSNQPSRIAVPTTFSPPSRDGRLQFPLSVVQHWSCTVGVNDLALVTIVITSASFKHRPACLLYAGTAPLN